MSSKVILLRYVARLCSSASASDIGLCLERGVCCDKTAVIIRRSRDGVLSIQGYPPVPQSEKHRAWTIFQGAVKHLFGIPVDTTVCIRFSYPPYETVGSLSALLREQNHLLDLVVHPIHPSMAMTNLEPDVISLHASLNTSQGSKRNDPHCTFGRKNSSALLHKHSQSAKGKCDFAEMNKLISQLTEVSISLHQTQQECHLIAGRCRDKAQLNNVHPNASASTFTRKSKVRVNHSTSISSSDSGKGSILDPQLDELEAMEEVDYQEDDKKIDYLLQIAQRLTQKIKEAPKRGSTLSLITPYALRSSLPDVPSELTVRPSFRNGGAYIMWNPVSLDGNNMNHGFKVLGYQIYLDYHFHSNVDSPLASQIELTGMVNGAEYIFQACTECEGSISSLTQPFTYRHQEINTLLPDQEPDLPSFTNHPEFSSRLPEMATYNPHSNNSKVARVHTWLENKNYLDVEEIDAGSPTHQQNYTSLRSHAPLHVHFADENICDDAKSISSSHTSGIVTDYPISPKLIPSCCDSNCAQGNSVDTDNTHMLKVSSSPHILQENVCDDSLSSEPTLCPSTQHNNFASMHINEPIFTNLLYRESIPHAYREEKRSDMNSLHGFSSRHGEVSRKKMLSTNLTDFKIHEGPEPPTEVTVLSCTEGDVSISWNPVRRDHKGCSNGFHVLGYRIYINGNYQQSVDGALTNNTHLTYPMMYHFQESFNNHAVVLHIRTRSMAAESLPSNSVSLNCHQFKRHQPRSRVKPKVPISILATNV